MAHYDKISHKTGKKCKIFNKAKSRKFKPEEDELILGKNLKAKNLNLNLPIYKPKA